ncbi:MAG: aminotransferase, partial [Rhodoglobus sp.]
MTTSRVKLRPEIEQIVPYRQGRTAAEDAFKLSSNENPFEPLDAVLEAIAESSINRYPEASAAALRDRLG